TYIRSLQADIILLQETHATPDDANFWTKRWQAPAAWSHYTSILVDKRHQIVQTKSHIESRIMEANIYAYGKLWKCAVIYAPNTSTERRQFFARLPALNLQQHDIVAGNWNT